MTADNLKKSILQQAIQGKLLPQNSADEPANELLKKIFAERQKLIEDGKFKAAPPLPPISPDEIPFDIPRSWQWVRLGDIGICQTGTTPNTNNPEYYGNDIPFLKPPNIYNNHIEYNSEGLSLKGQKVARTIDSNSVLMVCIGGSTGKSFICDRTVCCNQQINAITPYSKINHFYLLFSMQSPYFQNFLWGISSGTATNIVNKEKWRKILIPLPPLEEQKRIVAKLEELMPLIERLDAAEKKLAALDKAFPDQLRKSILQQAIQGKISEQLPTDGNASDLLADIRAEKNKLIADGKIKKEKPLPPISADEIPFDIPKNWQWVRLGYIGETNIGLTYNPQNISTEGTIVLRSGNIQNGKINYDDIVKVDMNIPENKSCKTGDILICARNGSKKLVGKAAIIDRDNLTFGAFMAVFRSNFNPYILEVINSPHFRKMLAGDVGTMTINQITQDMLKNFLVPLPPLAEQKRIVAKLEKILPLCDRLAEKLK